ncbi:MAG: alpha/beta fold hydrolase [Planctomycetes bacterium]|nr:alpha/beta fold hydrolase [Planctomycetota bacterium]
MRSSHGHLAPTLVLAVLALAPVPCAWASPEGRATLDRAASQDREAEYLTAFEEGLDLLRARRDAESMARFQRCIELYPERPDAYYNIACAHSLAGRKAEAVEWLSRSLDHGFDDLGHIAEDEDLDPIRGEAAFHELLARHRKGLLKGRISVSVDPSSRPKEGPATVVVAIHGFGDSASRFLGSWEATAEATGVVVSCPQGDLRVGHDSFRWGSLAEELVLAELDEAQVRWPGARLILAGFSQGGALATRVALRHPARLAGLLVLSGVLDEGALEPLLEGARAMPVYLVHGSEDRRTIAGARASLEAFRRAGLRAELEEFPGRHRLPPDLPAVVTRALAWFTAPGEPTPVPVPAPEPEPVPTPVPEPAPGPATPRRGWF